MNCTQILTHRESLGWWLNHANLLGEGVEVGSQSGQFAARILSIWKGAGLHLVDPWANLPKTEYLEEHAHVDYEDCYRTCQKLATDDSRVHLVRKRSKEAAPDFKTASLDFVYIDGNHDYRYVMEDLDLWFPKVKAGGLIGGHDFYTANEGGAWCQVDAAVIRWMREHNMPFTVTPCTSWWAIKA